MLSKLLKFESWSDDRGRILNVRLANRNSAILHRNEQHSQLMNHTLQRRCFLFRQIPLRFLLQYFEEIDLELADRQVNGHFAFLRLGELAQGGKRLSC